MHVVIRRGLLALLLICVAACQPLPQPFRSQPGERPPAALLRDGPGVIIDAPTGLYAPLDADLAEAVADALRQREFIAFSIAASQVRINRATYRLRGAAASQPTGLDGVAIPTLLGQPPGDGAAALPRALESVLKLRGVTATTDPAMMLPGAIRVVGTVTAGAIQPNGQRRVTISWVVQQSDGGEVGAVKLENDVPARLLEPRWGETALIVAEASLDGVADLIERARAAKK
jgi:hypothetical protein